jgi:hypothetical protein
MNRPNSKVLALRDPAAALLIGALAAPGSDFGVEFGGYDSYGFGAPDFGEDAPTAENMAQAWKEKQYTKQRERILSPNAGSSAKIQRYTFGITQTLTLETAVALSMSGNPQTYIRPQRVTSNAPLPAFCRLTAMQVGNVGVLVGGSIDAFDLAAVAQDAALDVPTLGPQNQVQVTGNYDALLPDGGYVTATSFRFIISFKGPASMTPSV